MGSDHVKDFIPSRFTTQVRTPWLLLAIISLAWGCLDWPEAKADLHSGKTSWKSCRRSLEERLTEDGVEAFPAPVPFSSISKDRLVQSNKDQFLYEVGAILSQRLITDFGILQQLSDAVTFAISWHWPDEPFYQELIELRQELASEKKAAVAYWAAATDLNHLQLEFAFVPDLAQRATLIKQQQQRALFQLSQALNDPEVSTVVSEILSRKWNP